VIDWEMATIGDPLLDLGLMLAFWGTERSEQIAMPKGQAFSRAPGVPGRDYLARRYEALTGRSTSHLEYYMVLALWKLAAIVEAAYGQYLAGSTGDLYARELERDVPSLLEEAAEIAGLP
jgi:aminoglycoside phosphotransferase (APT) family kinase protein